MSRNSAIAGMIVAAGLMAAHEAWAQAQPVDTQHGIRRGLRRANPSLSAQAPTAPQAPKMTPPAAVPMPPADAKKPAVPTARGPEQEYQDCLNLWDKGTHMTRSEWASTCRRIQNRLTAIGQQTSQLNSGRRRVR